MHYNICPLFFISTANGIFLETEVKRFSNLQQKNKHILLEGFMRYYSYLQCKQLTTAKTSGNS